MRPRRFRPAAAALAAAAAGLVTLVVVQVSVAAPAEAAACSGATGVTVVVDFNSLSGGEPPVQGACVSNGGGKAASSLFPAAGFRLSYAQRQNGFVCRVSDVPQSDPCTNTAPADAYWALWWSDGTDGRWNYSNLGVGSLKVPDGGYVAFSWDDVSGKAAPSYTPTARAAPAPQPPSRPSQQPQQPSDEPPSEPAAPSTTEPSVGGSTSAPPTPGAERPSGEPRATNTAPAGPRETSGTSTAPTKPEKPSKAGRPDKNRPGIATAPPTVDEDESETAASEALADPESPASSEASTADGGLPGWLAPIVIVLLFGIVAVVLLLQRRRPTP